MAIPRGLIRKITSDDDTYTQGLSLFLSGKVASVHLEDTDYKDEYKVKAVVEDEGKEYEVVAEIDDYNETIDGFECTCPAYLNYDGACKHIAAVLISQENVFFASGQKNRQKSEKTDSSVLEMIKNYSQKAANKAIAENSQSYASLIPVFKFTKNELFLGLKLDIGRTYVIKDIAKFYENMKNGAIDKYGANSMFLHDENNFSQSSRPLLNFVMTYFSPLSPCGAEKKYMKIAEHMADKLISMFCPGRVMALSPDGEYSLKLTEKSPDFYISIKKIGKKNYGISLEDNDFDIIKGRERIYIKKGTTLFAPSEEYSKKCAEILSLMQRHTEPVVVHSDDMSSLYSSVFRVVSDFIPIKSREDLSVFRPLPMDAKIYLDTDGEKLFAKVEFCYGDETTFAYGDAGPTQNAKDLEGELCVKTIIQRYLEEINEKEHIAIISGEENIYDFLTNGISELSVYAKVFVSDSLNKVQIRHPKNISVGARLDSGILNIEFGADEFPAEEMWEILESYRQKKKYHRLKDGSFLSLENEVFSDVFSITEGLHLNESAVDGKTIKAPAFRALYVDEILKNSSFSSVERNSELKKLIRDMKYVSDSDISEPETLKGVLRNYQKTGFKWLKTLEVCGFSGILADDMGLGKTLQIITLIKSKKEETGKVSSLVICPASLVLNWESEIEKFAPDLKAKCVIGSNSERAHILKKSQDADVLITSYELLKRDIEQYQDICFDYQVVDEAQYIKNYTTQNAMAVKSIQSKTKFALTGTPIENNLTELWSIFDFLMPGYLYSHSYFKNHFEIPAIREKDELAIKRLKAVVSPFILRRLKSDVLKELPEKHESVIYAKMGTEQQKLYVANALQIKQEFVEKTSFDKANRFMVLAMLMRLRQLCCDPSLVYENFEGTSAKLELCISLLESLTRGGHKVLVFSQFTSMLDILGKKLDEMKIPYYQIRGSTKKEDRKQQADSFNEDDTPVFLISLKAGGTGLNLTGADMVIHYDPWWNRSVQNQATDRAHRIGQKKSVQVYKLIVKDSIEEKILKLQEQKSDLADSIISAQELDILSLSKEEILKLFEV